MSKDSHDKRISFLEAEWEVDEISPWECNVIVKGDRYYIIARIDKVWGDGTRTVADHLVKLHNAELT